MIYDIIDSEELLARIEGINNWIEENKSNIGNANMYEIMSCMIARNNIRILEGKNEELDNEVERMITLRNDSINQFQSEVPESRALFDAVRDGLTGNSKEEMDFICKCQSVPFFINNARRRGFDGDITMELETQNSKAIPEFMHDNYNEVVGMATSYENAGDEIKKVTYQLVSWTVNNSVDELKSNITLTAISNTEAYAR